MTTSIKIDDELKTRIQRLASLRQRSAHWIVREAISRYLERKEAREAERHSSRLRDHTPAGRQFDHSHVEPSDGTFAAFSVLIPQSFLISRDTLPCAPSSACSC